MPSTSSRKRNARSEPRRVAFLFFFFSFSSSLSSLFSSRNSAFHLAHRCLGKKTKDVPTSYLEEPCPIPSPHAPPLLLFSFLFLFFHLFFFPALVAGFFLSFLLPIHGQGTRYAALQPSSQAAKKWGKECTYLHVLTPFDFHASSFSLLLLAAFLRCVWKRPRHDFFLLGHACTSGPPVHQTPKVSQTGTTRRCPLYIKASTLDIHPSHHQSITSRQQEEEFFFGGQKATDQFWYPRKTKTNKTPKNPEEENPSYPETFVHVSPFVVNQSHCNRWKPP